MRNHADLHSYFERRFDEVSAAVFVVTVPDGMIISVNTEAEDLTGYEKCELESANFTSIFREQDQSRISSIFDAPVEEQFRKLFEHNVIIQKRSKRKIVVDMGFRRVTHQDQTVLIFTLQDITDIKNNEARLSRAHNYIKNIISSMLESLFVVDQNHCIQTANQAACQQLGYSADELKGMSFQNIVEAGSKSIAIDELLRNNASETELNLVTRSGTLVPVLISASEMRQSSGDPLRQTVIVAMDISERKKAEALIASQQMMIVQASKLSSLGEMASGIAHEINNPVHIISGKCELMELMMEQDKIDMRKIQEGVQLIQQMAARINAIVVGLRNISRDQRHDPLENYSISAIVTDCLALCRERIQQHGIILRIPEAIEEFSIACRPTQISQVLLNLLNNAFDAVKDRPSPWIQLTVERTEDAVFIAVKDNGCGVDSKQREQIFMPFFTNKPLGQGTGLGLSVSRTLIEAHSGQLFLDLQSKHTCFVIKLPLVESQGAKRAG